MNNRILKPLSFRELKLLDSVVEGLWKDKFAHSASVSKISLQRI